MSKMDRKKIFFRPDNKLGRRHVNLYFLFYLVCSPEKSRMRPEAHVRFGSQASAVMLRLRLTNTKKRQFTQLLPLGSELHIGKEHCCLRGIDQLHGPTFHSICGNLIIYEPSLKKPFIFEHDRSLCAIINLLPIAAPLYEDGKNEKKNIYFFFNFFHDDRSWRSKHNSFPLWLTVFPEKRFSLSNQETSTTKVAIHTNLFTDLYALIGTGSFEIGWYITIIKLPFIFCIWIGFILASLGGLRSFLRQLAFYRLDWN
jgi:hypothetical protein